MKQIKEEPIKENLSISASAIIYAWDRSVLWGGSPLPITKKMITEIRKGIIENAPRKTGKHLWACFYKRNKNFVSSDYAMKQMGLDFLKHLKQWEEQ